MNRRGFLGSILAAAAAPAIVRADSLMRIVPRETLVVWGPNSIEMDMPNPWVRYAERVCNPAVLTLWGDGAHDDTTALQAWVYGERVIRPDGSEMDPQLAPDLYRTTKPIHFAPANKNRIMRIESVLWQDSGNGVMQRISMGP